MHDYFKKMVEIYTARKDFKSSIERIAKECDIDINIKMYTDSPIVTVWDKSVTVGIYEDGVSELVHTSDDIPIDKGWSIFLPKLRHLVENS